MFGALLVRRLLAQASHLPTLLEVTCERAFLAELMGDPLALPRCAVACHASVTPPETATPTSRSSGHALTGLQLDCMVLSDDGSRQHRELGSVDLTGASTQALQAASELGKRLGVLMAGRIEEMGVARA